MIIPKAKNHPAFDAFLYNGTRWLLLQVTINKKKVLNPKLLRNFALKFPNLLDNGKLNWYGIVPPSEGLRTNDFGMASDEHQEWAKSNVIQHVIPFPRKEDTLHMYSPEDQAAFLSMKNEYFKGIKETLRSNQYE